MRLIYEKTDITGSVEFSRCVYREADSRAGLLEIELENAKAWARWGAKAGDRVEVTESEFSTGALYLLETEPEEGAFMIRASALPEAARARAWRSYEGMTLQEIVDGCAVESGTDWAMHGLDGGLRYEYIVREQMGCAAFVQALLTKECATLLCRNGKLHAIGYEYAQTLPAAMVIQVNAGDDGARHSKRDGCKLRRKALCVDGARIEAEDTAVAGDAEYTYPFHSASDVATAGRWARGLLYAHNRAQEALELDGEFNPAMAALARMDVAGAEATAGRWMVGEVEHDLIEMATRATLRRCIDSIR